MSTRCCALAVAVRGGLRCTARLLSGVALQSFRSIRACSVRHSLLRRTDRCTVLCALRAHERCGTNRLNESLCAVLRGLRPYPLQRYAMQSVASRSCRRERVVFPKHLRARLLHLPSRHRRRYHTPHVPLPRLPRLPPARPAVSTVVPSPAPFRPPASLTPRSTRRRIPAHTPPSRTHARLRYAPARSGRRRCSHGLTCTAMRRLRVRCIPQPLRSQRRRRTARAASSSCGCARSRRSARWERRESGGCRARWTRRSLPTVWVRSAPTATIIRLGALPPGPPPARFSQWSASHRLRCANGGDPSRLSRLRRKESRTHRLLVREQCAHCYSGNPGWPNGCLSDFS